MMMMMVVKPKKKKNHSIILNQIDKLNNKGQHLLNDMCVTVTAKVIDDDDDDHLRPDYAIGHM